jgi:hypothetical protein
MRICEMYVDCVLLSQLYVLLALTLTTVDFVHVVYLWVSYDFQCKQ